MKKLLTKPSVLTILKTFNKNIAIFALLFSMCAHSSSAVDRSCAEDSKPTFGKKYDDFVPEPYTNLDTLNKCLINMYGKKIKDFRYLQNQEAKNFSITLIYDIIKSAQDSLDVMEMSLKILDPNRFNDIRPSVHSRKLKEDALSNQSLVLSLATGETDEKVKCFNNFSACTDHVTEHYGVTSVFGNPLDQITNAMKNFFKAFHDCDKSHDEKIPLLQDALTIMGKNLDQVKILAHNWIK